MPGPIPARSNRFDTMRLVFALAVLFSHVLVLPDMPGTRQVQSISNIFGELSIQGFFILSGGLVYGSWNRRVSIGNYALKRVRRLYPAYSSVIFATVILALIFVPEVRADLGTTFKYILANITFLNFLQPTLPGIFEGQRFEEINGALWTVKVEVMYYLVLPILVITMNAVGKFRWVLLALVYIAAEIWRAGFAQYGHANGSYALIQISRQLPGQMSFFVSGIILWEFRQFIRARWWMFALGGFVVVLTSYLPHAEPLRAAGWCALIGGIAFSPGPELNAARYGDFSYGIYGTHFPITQAIIAMGVFQYSIWAGYATAIVVTILVAVARWNLIEKWFLESNNWYREKSRQHAMA